MASHSPIADPYPIKPRKSGWFKAFLYLLPVLFVTCLFIPNYYYSPEISARVVTAEGTPVAGAIVLASWTMHSSWTNYPVGQLKVAEVITDANGWFRIPAWGPVRAESGLNVREPVVRIFKPRLVPLIIYNTEGVGMTMADHIIRFRLQGQSVTLERFSGRPAEYFQTLLPLLNSLSEIQGASSVRCQWRDRHRILLAVQDLPAALTIGRPVVARYDNDFLMNNCGDPQ